ncbi:MAG: class B sortase [Lachnospiraceae bacterium]|nr:class B sortase [Lachnospiraceae bacterium]
MGKKRNAGEGSGDYHSSGGNDFGYGAYNMPEGGYGEPDGNYSYYSSANSGQNPGGYYNGGRQTGSGNANGSRGSGKSPRKKKKSRAGDVISIIVMAAAFCVFIYAGYMLYGYYKEYQKVDEEYLNLATSYTADETETEDLDALEEAFENDSAAQVISGREVRTVEVDDEEVSLPVMANPIDFESLKEVNSDIVGWLKIRALDLSYPVVQGEDNDYYLHRSFEQEDLFAGCLFMHYENKSDYTDQNTIIYGHNMKNGSMFGTLKKFRDEEVYETSKYFWIYTEDIIYQYRIFSARVVDKVGQTYQIVFSTDEFEEFLTTAIEESEVDNSTVSVTTDDKVVTLSTCTGDSATRFVVQGKLVQMYASLVEDEEEEVSP